MILLAIVFFLALAHPAPADEPKHLTVRAAPQPLPQPTLRLPSFLVIPDLYTIDPNREPPRFADPVDRNNYISIDLRPIGSLGACSISLRFDVDDRVLDAGDVVRLRFRWRF